MAMQHCLGSPQQFCLRWNNYQSNLTHVFDQLLQNESFVDVTLACEGHSVKAHKMVLSACSPYFQTLFFENPCKHPIVILKDIRWPELKAVVEFMYKGEINVSQEQIGPLLQVAESLKIRGLADVTGEESDGKTVREPIRDSGAGRDARDALREPTGKESPSRDGDRDRDATRDAVKDAARDAARDAGRECDRERDRDRERDLVTRELVTRGSPRDAGGARDGSRDPSRERESSSRPPSSLGLGGHDVLPLSLPLALSSSHVYRHKKRRRPSAERYSPYHGAGSPESATPVMNHVNNNGTPMGTPGSPSHGHGLGTPGTPAGGLGGVGGLAEPLEGALGPAAPPPQPPPPLAAPQLQSLPAAADLTLAMPPPPPSLTDDLEIKPGIAEMIREEERVSDPLVVVEHARAVCHRPGRGRGGAGRVC
ncbi:Protein bric-a-brac 2 [Frankliniella fusca]|uniref:Protein bric-a-brac 2 n=1 Tax=Frankliniella fusca TaxID=407009 RepID=A0AAE1I2A1_9NEOP|nr:Protein bric-a-brac 2 [Frankliniella fusca]